jgi:hypothetical protein
LPLPLRRSIPGMPTAVRPPTQWTRSWHQTPFRPDIRGQAARSSPCSGDPVTAGERGSRPTPRRRRYCRVYRKPSAPTSESEGPRAGYSYPVVRTRRGPARPQHPDRAGPADGTSLAPPLHMATRWRSVCIVMTPGSGEGRARGVVRRLARLLRRRGPW